ncbi:Harpin-induced [Heracleum sosnowskyi]|uniref:Harpin-induced n=1 Tax=Heracleum sosnowskyi TaxID=360622 RepID=A0AAD8J926_9APIA|nr:Harpin-induced [Heracleum sosnowskyi]
MEGGEESKAKTHHQNDGVHSLKRRRRRRSICICIGTTISILLLLIIIIVILAFTVYKAKRPVITVSSVSLYDFNFDVDFPLKIHLNLSLDVDLTVKNPNKVAFKYVNTVSSLKFEDKVIGEVPIPAGKIKASGFTPMNLTLTVMAERLLGDSDVYSDVFKSGTLPVSTYTRIKGSVRILHLFDIHVVSYSSCDIKISISSRTIQDQSCQYKTKL